MCINFLLSLSLLLSFCKAASFSGGGAGFPGRGRRTGTQSKLIFLLADSPKFFFLIECASWFRHALRPVSAYHAAWEGFLDAVEVPEDEEETQPRGISRPGAFRVDGPGVRSRCSSSLLAV